MKNGEYIPIFGQNDVKTLLITVTKGLFIFYCTMRSLKPGVSPTHLPTKPSVYQKKNWFNNLRNQSLIFYGLLLLNLILILFFWPAT